MCVCVFFYIIITHNASTHVCYLNIIFGFLCFIFIFKTVNFMVNARGNYPTRTKIITFRQIPIAVWQSRATQIVSYRKIQKMRKRHIIFNFE